MLKAYVTVGGATFPANRLRIWDENNVLHVYDHDIWQVSVTDPDQVAALRWWVGHNSEDIFTAEERWAAAQARYDAALAELQAVGARIATDDTDE